MSQADTNTNTNTNADTDGMGVTAAIWLTMLKNGEWLTAREVTRLLATECPEVLLDVTSTSNNIDSMARVGSLIKSMGGERKNAYMVTPQCRLPRGVTLEQVLKAASWMRDLMRGEAA